MKAVIIASIIGVTLFTSVANASHDRIYSPCSTEYGHVHMSFEEVSARVSIMEQEGVIPAGMISRYVEARDGGKGNEDPRFVWARHLEEGQILSLGNWANGEHPELEQLMFDSGLVAEWQLDANKRVRRFNDPYWMQENPLSPSFTVWESLCMANLGYSVPVFEINDAGQWVTNIPATTTTAPPVTTTTIFVSSPVSQPLTEEPIEHGTVDEVFHNPPSQKVAFPLIPLSAVGDYDLFDAEWDGYPFEATVRLLEERYPPNTPDRFHFRLSYAVEFLRKGGMVKGLDNLWESGLTLND